MAFDRSSDHAHDTDLADVLLPGTALLFGQYRVGTFLNAGGFGITYLAKDSLDRDVVLKECFAPDLCLRRGTSVLPRSRNSTANLQKVLTGFRNEAQVLASLSHPNIVRIHQVFDDNGTAYMALDHIKGHDLLEIVDEKKATLTPGQIVAMARKLISALAHVHDRQILHCDISPDNICVRQDGEPVLIDFGSARAAGPAPGQTELGLAMVKDGYSPHELYNTNGSLGPWTDIYSLGASLYHAITGKAPVDCQRRLSAKAEGRDDPLAPLVGTAVGYPASFLASVDKAMSVKANARHQTARDWLKTLSPFAASPDRPATRCVVLFRRSAAPAVAGDRIGQLA